MRPARPGTRRRAVVVTGALLLAVAGCGSPPDQAAPPAADTSGPPPQASTSTTSPGSGAGSGKGEMPSVEAERVMQVTEVHEETGMTLLEGPVFGPDGGLYLVDVTAPPGEPEVLRVDVDTQDVSTVYTDDSSAFTSAQIGPHDGRLHLTDILEGQVESITLEGKDPRVHAAGPVEGSVMQPDDLTFDEEGNAYVSDTAGFDDPGGPDRGRVVRVDAATGDTTVLAEELPAPNGISFSADFSALLVSGYTVGRLDRLDLGADRTQVVSTSTFAEIDVALAQVDPTAVDAEGNVHQALHNRAGLAVLDAAGQEVATVDTDITTPDHSATNMAVRPGTTRACTTVSGPTGGHLYAFDAFAGSTRQSNSG